MRILFNKTNNTTILLFIIFICISAPSVGQTSMLLRYKEKIADHYYDVYAYPKAIQLYNKILQKDSLNVKVLQRIANAYYLTGLKKKSETTYAKLQRLNKLTTDDIVTYAKILKQNKDYGKFDKLINTYNDSISKSPHSTLLASFDIEKYSKDSANFQITNLERLNTPQSDFAPSFYKKNSIVYTSSGLEQNPGNTYDWNGQPFLNLYSANVSAYGHVSKPKPFLSEKLNTRFHEGSACFNKKSKIIYFTRNNYVKFNKERSKDETLHLTIFKARIRYRSIQDIETLSINNKEFSCGHPALSPDEKRLYFVSDMPGGFGGTDIYYCNIVDGKLSKPINLGKTINTSENEMFPFIHKSGDLYFTSNGHPGFGGLDIFCAEKSKDGFSKPENMGYPINTNNDDFSFILDEKRINSYFASNRPGGKGDDDIYRAKYVNNEPVLIEGIVKKPNNKNVNIAEITAINSSGIEKKVKSEKYGRFEIELLKGDIYDFTFESDGLVKHMTIDLTKKDVIQKFEKQDSYYDFKVELEERSWVFNGVVGDRDNGDNMSNLEVFLRNNKSLKIEKTVTDENGNFSFKLEPDSDYSITVKNNNFFGSSIEISTKDLPKGGMLTKEILIDELTVNKSIVLENIYYDYRKWNIRKDACEELDRLVDILKKNTKMVIELSSHTDSRGNKRFNRDLSQKRAQSAVNYIIKQGIDKSRLTAKGYGEEKLINYCDDEAECSEEEHQENRRTEFRIISY